jgi:3-carboxy-cis,cis-muconate cycloisomerase
VPPDSLAAVSWFDGVYGSPAVGAQLDDRAWLQAMLDAERALALAGAAAGLVPAEHAATVAAACTADRFDPDVIGAGAAAEATPVIALVARLRELAGPAAAPWVHHAATSQDVLDTAAMLVARRALRPALADADRAAAALALLAATHRDTPQLGRTLLQPAVRTTFGAACAVRLVAVDDASGRLRAVVRDRLAAQLGGAAGTLAPAGDRAAALVTAFAAELGLAEPVTPWHTTRGRVAELAAAAGVLAGELAAVAQDLVLLAGFGELADGAAGGSSSMPHKQNPARAVLAVACAHRVPGLVGTVLAGMPQELQRAAGRWQAEWGTLTALLGLLGGVTAHTAAALDGLLVRPDVMAAHLEQVGAGADPGSAGLFVDRALAHHAALAATEEDR